MLFVEDCKGIAKALSDFKNIRELNLTKCNLNTAMFKEIADGLMRAKQLEIIRMGDNIAADPTTVIYNLAFSPKIKMIDLTNVTQASSAACMEAFYKLLKISGSIETLLLPGCDFMKGLSNDFCEALGENKTIEHLNFDHATRNGTGAAMWRGLLSLAKGIAMNKYKNGSLSYVSLYNVNDFSTNDRIHTFFEAFKISEYDHEMMYGEQKIAKEMKLSQLDRKFHSGLKTLNLGSSYILPTKVFKLKDYEVKSDPEWPAFIEFIKQTQLESLDLSKCNIQHNQLEVFTTAISNKPSPCTHLKVLNLSNNALTQLGATHLAPVLEENKSLEFLDLSHTKMGVYGVTLIAKSLHKNTTLKGLNLFKNTLDVDGARALRDMLRVNTAIEWLDIGHNRIRQKGLAAIAQGIL
jgi:Ran GTPase-activating protein (RanGAP) involved in mRNA processing and transport